MKDWTEGEIRWIALETIGERYRRYRLPDAAAEAAMAGSLGRYGQLSPLAVCLREERPEVLDGFKRVAAARTLPAVTSLQARLVEVDEPTAKAIILGLNGIGGRMKELEEAWIVQALVREDGLSQLQVAELLAAAQELGLSSAGAVGAAFGGVPRGSASGAVVADDGAAVDAVARGQPDRGCGGRAARASDGGRGAWGGGLDRGLLRADRRWSSFFTSRGGRCGRRRSRACRRGTRD